MPCFLGGGGFEDFLVAFYGFGFPGRVSES